MKKQMRTDGVTDTPKIKKDEDVFTDEEVKELEKELIQTYLSSGDHPIRVLFRMYKKYIKEISLSLFFFFIKTLPVIVLPVMTANIINLVAKPPKDFYHQLIFNIVVMVFLFLLNIPTHNTNIIWCNELVYGCMVRNR